MQLRQMWCWIVLAFIGNGPQRQHTRIPHSLIGMPQSLMQCQGPRRQDIRIAKHSRLGIQGHGRPFPIVQIDIILRLLVRVILRLPLVPRFVEHGHQIFPPQAFDVRSMAFGFPFFGGAVLCFFAGGWSVFMVMRTFCDGQGGSGKRNGKGATVR